jgi:hypothetical protein
MIERQSFRAELLRQRLGPLFAAIDDRDAVRTGFPQGACG